MPPPGWILKVQVWHKDQWTCQDHCWKHFNQTGIIVVQGFILKLVACTYFAVIDTSGEIFFNAIAVLASLYALCIPGLYASYVDLAQAYMRIQSLGPSVSIRPLLNSHLVGLKSLQKLPDLQKMSLLYCQSQSKYQTSYGLCGHPTSTLGINSCVFLLV